jgi:exo-beta-1,3-glucanase (GH17 family)
MKNVQCSVTPVDLYVSHVRQSLFKLQEFHMKSVGNSAAAHARNSGKFMCRTSDQMKQDSSPYWSYHPASLLLCAMLNLSVVLTISAF